MAGGLLPLVPVLLLLLLAAPRTCRLLLALLPPLQKQCMKMTQDHRVTRESSLAAQAGRAKGTTASQHPAPSPCGPAAGLPRQYVIIDGFCHTIDNLQFGAGPSSAPPCPDCSTHVWQQGAWRRVHTNTYAAAVAGGAATTTPAPSCPPRVAALPIQPAPAVGANAAAPGSPTAVQARNRAGPAAPSSLATIGSSRAQVHRHRVDNNWGYQVKLFGPRRAVTTIAQVRLAGKDAVDRVAGSRGDVPFDLLNGRALWAGRTAVVFDLPSTAVCKLTAGMVAMLKQKFLQQLHWRVIFTYDGTVIQSVRGAYAGHSHTCQRERIGAGLVLSNRFAALEPEIELSQVASQGDASTAESDSGSSGWCTEDEELVPASEDGDEPADAGQAVQDTSAAGQEQGQGHSQHTQGTSAGHGAARRRRRRRSRAPVQPSRGLVCGILNVNNMPRAGQKLAEISLLLRDLKCDFMGFVETKESTEERRPANLIPGYIYFSKARGGGGSGGVGAAVHVCLAEAVKPFSFATQQYEEAMWFVMQRQGTARKMFIGVVYMPDMSKSSAVRTAAYVALQEDLQYLSTMGAVVVMGDFNARVGQASMPTAHIGMHGEQDHTINSNGRLLLSLLTTLDMYTLNARTAPTSPGAHLTLVRPSGSSLIDYIIATPDIAMPCHAAAGPQQ